VSRVTRSGIVPVVNVLPDLIFGETVALLDFALKLIPPAVDGGQVVVGEVSPLFLDLALHLLPVSLDAIPVHFNLPEYVDVSRATIGGSNCSVEAKTPEQALALAQKLYVDELHTDGPSRLWFEPYIDMTVNEIAVCDADGNELAAWYDDDMRLRFRDWIKPG
jgi:hypothetical protein